MRAQHRAARRGTSAGTAPSRWCLAPGRRARDLGLPLALLGLVVAPGCAVGPDYQAPEPEIPDAWHLEFTPGIDSGEADLHSGWAAPDASILGGLIERAAVRQRGDRP